VKHKERVKQMRKLVDVLTLTATPIPRTLQMGLVGIRDLSVIETPPVDRQAIRTYVTKYDEGLVRETIQRELDRDGQVFFVHNRVETIEVMGQRIRDFVPAAKVAVAHGQMAGAELEKVMLAFMAREVNVLVCSAIIESGLDIPNANTMIINRADQFGLAQLYQLRGRVGRSHQRAYAYLMIPGEHLITKDAQKRLKVLQELDELGGGFRLAAHDLEIRGAGNLLGKQQSGHVAAIGFEMYEQMLAEAVRELRGEQLQTDIEPEIQLGIPAFIPDSYIDDEQQRLVIYRRLASIRNDEELDNLTIEMRERFGPLPSTVDSFVRLMDLRRHLRAHQVVRAVRREDWITLQFHPSAPVEVDTLLALVQKNKKTFRMTQDFQLSFLPAAKDWDGIVAETKAVLEQLRAN
jgi:transcription-repair coupling factor (superfamily II helicase)